MIRYELLIPFMALACDGATPPSTPWRVIYDNERISIAERQTSERAGASAQPGQFALSLPDRKVTVMATVKRQATPLPACAVVEHADDRAASYARLRVHDDELLRVLRIDVAAGGQSPLIFFDDPGFVYIYRPARLRFSYPLRRSASGPVIEVADHHWNEGEPPHVVEVVGKRALGVLRFEVKRCR